VQFAAGRIALDSPQVVLAAISPGPISIPGKYLNGLEREKPEELLLWFKLNRIPTMRLLKVEEILNLVNYIISEDGSYMNGSVIDINGGAG
jgi:NAD(P)-dependent dehydrogenase (short-subunit alcohol dehydrogenase family)